MGHRAELSGHHLCLFVGIHPNIPGLGTPRWKKALRRLELMFWSIIAPELNISWAATQWLAVRHLKNEYGEYGYSIQMGGFMLYNGDEAAGILGPAQFEDLFLNKSICLPSVTEEEIFDRSKGDGLSKALVTIQTSGFIVRCIARRLGITELELVTLALATLNVVMHAFWWNKPLDVQTTVGAV